MVHEKFHLRWWFSEGQLSMKKDFQILPLWFGTTWSHLYIPFFRVIPNHDWISSISNDKRITKEGPQKMNLNVKWILKRFSLWKRELKKSSSMYNSIDCLFLKKYACLKMSKKRNILTYKIWTISSVSQHCKHSLEWWPLKGNMNKWFDLKKETKKYQNLFQ